MYSSKKESTFNGVIDFNLKILVEETSCVQSLIGLRMLV